MTQFEFIDEVSEVMNTAYNLIVSKNADYSGDDALANLMDNSFGISPVTALIVRMRDKLRRLATFNKKGVLNVEDEKIQDTLLDLANYAFLTYIVIEHSKNESTTKNTD